MEKWKINQNENENRKEKENKLSSPLSFLTALVQCSQFLPVC